MSAVSIEHMAQMDFDRARRKAFWRRVLSWITGDSNDLLPFDEIRHKLPFRGQHYLGFMQVPIDKIVGSSGRYRDFDRAFLPIQGRTRGRWLSIDQAHYQDVFLPPVDLYKMGGIYFVKDGNHRVSVARERGQDYIDAIVTEVVIPIPLTPDIRIDDLLMQKEQMEFLEKTQLDKLRADHRIRITREDQQKELLEHIAVHRWYLGEQKKQEVSFEEAVLSWYEEVYLPLVESLEEQELLGLFPNLSETDLYLWIIKYLYYLRQGYREESTAGQIATPERDISARNEAVRQVLEEYPVKQLSKLASVLRKAEWLDNLILNQERAAFYRRTGLIDVYPEADLETSTPGGFEKLLEHIEVHRWYLGEQQGREVPYPEAVKSWYENVYLPLVTIIREQDILSDFPGRTETDLYLWIISHQWYLRESMGDEVPVEQVAEKLVEAYSERLAKKKKASPKNKVD
jgi:hypothetical protein